MAEALDDQAVKCPACGCPGLILSGISVPSETKSGPGHQSIERDYILRCPRCHRKMIVPDLPPSVATSGGGGGKGSVSSL